MASVLPRTFAQLATGVSIIATLTVASVFILRSHKITGEFLYVADAVGTVTSTSDVSYNSSTRLTTIYGLAVGAGGFTGSTVPPLQTVTNAGASATNTLSLYGGFVAASSSVTGTLNVAGTLAVTGNTTLASATATNLASSGLFTFSTATGTTLRANTATFGAATLRGTEICTSDGVNCPTGVSLTGENLLAVTNRGGIATSTLTLFGGFVAASSSVTGTLNVAGSLSVLGGATTTALFSSSAGFTTATSVSLFANSGTFGPSTIGTLTVTGNTTLAGATSTSFYSTSLGFSVASGTTLRANTAAFASATIGGQSVCLADGTNCSSSFLDTLQSVTARGSFTTTTIQFFGGFVAASSSVTGTLNIAGNLFVTGTARFASASSTFFLSGASAIIGSTAPIPTSTAFSVNGVPSQMYAFNASTTNCIYWMPGSLRGAWNGGVIVPKISWTAATGTGSVVWQLSGQSLASATYLGVANIGPYAYATSALGGGYFRTITQMDSFTPQSAAAGIPVRWQLCRIGASAGDTLGADAYAEVISATYETPLISD